MGPWCSSESNPRQIINGQPAAAIAVADRGLLYGDGVFRTLRIEDGVPLWWDEHLAKLAADCQQLGIPAPDASLWQSDLAQLALQEGFQDGILKLIVTRGQGTRGYAPPAPCLPTRILQALPPPAPEPDHLHARWCNLRLALQPALAGAKHLNRLEQVLARAEWSDPAIGEGLLCDTEGFVISGIMNNLWVLQGEHLLTPKIDRCGVAGVARSRLLRLAPGLGLTVLETRIQPADLEAAEAVFVCNSVRGLRWLASFGDQRWSEPACCAELQEALWHGV